MPTSWPGTWIEVGSTKDLKPESFDLGEAHLRSLLVAFSNFENDTIRRSFSADFSRAFSDALASQQTLEDFRQSVAAPRLPDLHGDSGIHLLVPDDGQPDFAVAVARVRSRPPVRGAEGAQAVRLVVSRRRRVPRGGHQPILDDLVKATQPRYMKLTAKFNVRGGILHQRGGRASQRGMEVSRLKAV
jgi:hypothetical protein